MQLTLQAKGRTTKQEVPINQNKTKEVVLLMVNGASVVKSLVRLGQYHCAWLTHTHRTVAQFQKHPQGSVWSMSTFPQSERERGCLRSAAAEFGEEIGHTEKDPHHHQVGAEGQQGQRVQEAGVQPEVPHRQQTAQVLLDHPLPRPNSEARGGGGRRCGAAKKGWMIGKVVQEQEVEKQV